MGLGLAWNTVYLDAASSRLNQLCGRAEVEMETSENWQPSTRQDTRESTWFDVAGLRGRAVIIR